MIRVELQFAGKIADRKARPVVRDSRQALGERLYRDWLDLASNT